MPINKDQEPKIKTAEKGENEPNGKEAESNPETDVEQLKIKVEQIRSEIFQLQEDLIKAQNNAKTERAKILDLWKNKFITSAEEFKKLSEKISELENKIFTQINLKNTEFRMARIDYLSKAVIPDELRQKTLELNIRNNLENFQNKNIQEGGSNAQGVFEIENENLILIKKSKGTFEFEGTLPYIMQDIDTDRIPRILDVFQTGEATFKIMEKAKGIQLDKLSQDQIADIPQEHFNNFAKDIARLDELGLQFDPSKNSNFFYDPQIGFSIIDISDFLQNPENTNNPSNLSFERLTSILTGTNENPKIIDKIKKALNI